MTFIISSLMLLAGPFLFALATRHEGSRQAMDGFILITIAGIVGLHIVPEAWRVAGLSSLIFGVLGLAFPILLERLFSRALEQAHVLVLSVAAAGVVVHAVLDGMALQPIGNNAGLLSNGLALGVILHRLPVGMAIWWVVRPQFGTVVAMLTFALVIGATGTSYYLGAGLLNPDTLLLALFQSFVAGSLVHVALFGIHHDHAQHAGGDGKHAHQAGGRTESRPFRLGVLIGLVMVFILPHVHVG